MIASPSILESSSIVVASQQKNVVQETDDNEDFDFGGENNLPSNPGVSFSQASISVLPPQTPARSPSRTPAGPTETPPASEPPGTTAAAAPPGTTAAAAPPGTTAAAAPPGTTAAAAPPGTTAAAAAETGTTAAAAGPPGTTAAAAAETSGTTAAAAGPTFNGPPETPSAGPENEGTEAGDDNLNELENSNAACQEEINKCQKEINAAMSNLAKLRKVSLYMNLNFTITLKGKHNLNTETK